MQFNVAFLDEFGDYHYNRTHIAKYYLKSWFLIDFLSNLPINFVLGLICNFFNLRRRLNNKHLRKLFKNFKIFKNNETFENFEIKNIAIKYSRSIGNRFFYSFEICCCHVSNNGFLPSCKLFNSLLNKL